METMPPPTPATPTALAATTPDRARLRAIMALATAGLVLSAYLASVSLSASGRPPGCEPGSGCERVLASRWGGIGPIPVGALAGAGYAALLACIAATRRARNARRAWTAAAVLSVGILASVVWFLTLQLAVLRAVCLYCMADHALGAGAAVLVLATVTSRRRPLVRRGVVIVAGVVTVAILIGFQFLFPHRSMLVRLPLEGNFDSGPGPERTVSLLDGSLRLDPPDEPILGSPEATHVLVWLYDYASPECRRMRDYLAEAVARWPRDLAVVALPCPLNASCNPHVAKTEARYADSCEVARIALAVWRADPGRFAAMDAWLFAPETARGRERARAEAQRLIGVAALERALADPLIREMIARNAEAFGRSGSDRLPIVLSPEIGGIAGRPQSKGELFSILSSELGLPAR